LRITTVRDAEAAAARAADVVGLLLDEALAARGVAHLALAGGSTPKRCHELLAERRESWDGVHLWESDERCVAPDDDESNWKMIDASLVSRIAIDEAQLHRAPGELGPDAGADAYEDELRRVIDAAGAPVLDIVMCGLGEDGHTMSLFPGHPEVHERSRLVVGVRESPKPPPDRLSFTLPVAHAARRTILLTAGASKADALAAVLEGEDERVPASLLRGGRLEVIADDAAAPSHGISAQDS
jgi:6-phosphogluconolactonase